MRPILLVAAWLYAAPLLAQAPAPAPAEQSAEQPAPTPGAEPEDSARAERAERDACLRCRVEPADASAIGPAVSVSSIGNGGSNQATPRTAERRAGTRVMDTLDLGTTSITGNQELPKVLYIVPWKRSDLGDVVGRPVNTLLDEVLAPVDPDVFERHLDYYEALHGADQQE
jgi:hypothetical protein